MNHYRHTTQREIILLIMILALPLSSANSAEKAGHIDMSTVIIKVAKQTIPAVVHIEVTEQQVMENPYLPFENDPFFRRFFNIPQMPKKFKREMRGLGSGMILDTQGHILTNHHVAGHATKIDVLLSNGERFTAKRVGTDAKTDLAVIKISAKGALPHITFGDSDKVEVGEWVVAIGAPRGLDQTVTQGIISAKHRRGISNPSGYQDFLQTDAAINPGNSGGPLLNLQGQVIGVNAVIVSESGGFEGIGFTIPSNIASHVAKAIIAHGKVERGWLGLDISDLTMKSAKTVHVESTNGALVLDIVKGGPAEIAGIKKNDVIVAFGGKAVSDAAMLRNQVADAPIGQDVIVAVKRNGQQNNLTVKIGNLESAGKVLAVMVKDLLGIEVRAITPREKRRYSLDDNQGVAITKVDTKGALGEAGFEVGDIILGIDNQPITDFENFMALASGLKPKQQITILALDHRTGNMGNIHITIK
ncbi:MAG: hypothetical protein CSYNP_02642 [Syntrophus sp. SKADARSKE-3]|nr:hypothetical protein [Syntrophus sp. SKADARSKE-3]